jgi:hypothetical protein
VRFDAASRVTRSRWQSIKGRSRTAAGTVENRSGLSPQEHTGLLHKWGNDAARNQELADVPRGPLDE